MPQKKPKGGRPTKMTHATLGKLREAYLLGCTDEEACLVANIHPSSLYKYQQEHEKFSEEKEVWKMNPILKARRTLFKNLDNIATARWYLERKHKAEFGTALPTSDRNEKQSLSDLMRELEEEDKAQSKRRVVYFKK